MRKNTKLGLIIATPLLALMVGCAPPTDASDDTGPAPAVAPPSSEPPDVLASAEPTRGADAATPSPSTANGSVADPAMYGESVGIGNWNVAVVKVEPDITQEARDAALAEYGGDEQFFVGPSGQYAAVTVTATYNGDALDESLGSLSPVLYGSDGLVYSGATSVSSLPGDYFDQPGMLSGTTQTGRWVFDVPAAAVADPTTSFVSVETTYVFDDVPMAVWTYDGTGL